MTTKAKVRVTTDGMVRFDDGFANFLAGLGFGNPKTAANTYVLECNDHDLETAYRTSTWFGKIVDIPADDATRAWRSWKTNKEEIELLEKEERRLQVRAKVRQALIWARLHGGAVIIPVGLPGDPSKPLNLNSVRQSSIVSLSVLPKMDINPGNIILNPLSPWLGQPEKYTLNYGSGQQELHPSRVIRFIGRSVPSRTSNNQQGWGDSVWMHMRDAVTSSDAGASVIAAMMQEAKIDVVKLPEMMASMATAEYEQLMLKRFTMAAMLKSVSNVLLLDKDDDWQQKTMNWTGIPAVMEILLTIMSGAADIPVTRLIGTSAKGLNATGDGDLRNYYDNVKAKQELVLQPQLNPLDDIFVRSALGKDPDDLWYDWNSLFQMTKKEEADIDKTEAETAKIYSDIGVLPTEVLEKVVQNRMIESGRWPGMEEALEDAEGQLEPEEVVEPVVTDAAPRTLYVRRDVVNAAEILSWAKEQGFTSTLAEDDLHVTIAFSRDAVDWMKVGQAWEGELTLPEGGPRLMQRFGEATVLLFSSMELEWRHERIKEVGGSWDHPEYQPHITISYKFEGDIEDVTPYRGKIILGPEIFEEVNEDWNSTIVEV